MDFSNLIRSIQQAHVALQHHAIKAINRALTIRNWLFGFYIVEFEQKGEDRATYGSRLREEIAERIKVKGLTAPELSRCRQFYQTYPQILGFITQEYNALLSKEILGLPTQELESNVSGEEKDHYKKVVFNISYTHLTELIKIDDQLKRKYYELLILKTFPSVKELKRQIHSFHLKE